MRRVFAFTSTLATSVSLLVLAGSCSDEGTSSSTPVIDAASETPLLGEASSPERDADAPPGDVCGARTGLSSSAPWPLRGGCSTRAGRASNPGPQSATVSSNVPLLAGASSPAVASGALVWVGTTSGVAAVSSGVVRLFHPAGAVKSSPAIDARGNAIVAGGDGVLYSLAPFASAEPDAGSAPRIVFALALGSSQSSPAIGGDGTIYIGTDAGKLVAVPSDGSTIAWSFDTHDTGGSSPAIGQDGTVYVGSSDQKLYAVAPSGMQRWALDLGSPITASPTVGGDGSIYVGTSDGRLHAVAAAGTERWSYATGGPIKASAAVYAGTAYVGSDDKKLHAVSTLDGKPRWTYATLGAVATPVIGEDDTIYVGATDSRLYALTPRGSLFFAVNVKGPVTSAPAIAFGATLYVTTNDGLVAVGP